MADQNKLSEALRRLVQAPENNLQIVHGFVAKYNKPENDNSLGTVDVISMDGTINISDIPLNSVPGLSKGQMFVPTIKSDITLLWAVGTGDASILSFSHLDSINSFATEKVKIGVISEINNQEVDYNELENDGNKTETIYESTKITTQASNKTDSATFTIEPDKISNQTGKSEIELNKEQISLSVGSSKETITESGITLDGKQIILGAGAIEPGVLGNQLVSLMMEFMTECSKIMTPTMLGTMPIINMANFLSFLSKCNSILSKNVTLK